MVLLVFARLWEACLPGDSAPLFDLGLPWACAGPPSRCIRSRMLSFGTGDSIVRKRRGLGKKGKEDVLHSLPPSRVPSVRVLAREVTRVAYIWVS